MKITTASNQVKNPTPFWSSEDSSLLKYTTSMLERGKEIENSKWSTISYLKYQEDSRPTIFGWFLWHSVQQRNLVDLHCERESYRFKIGDKCNEISIWLKKCFCKEERKEENLDKTLVFIDDRWQAFTTVAIEINGGTRHVSVTGNYEMNEGMHVECAGVTRRVYFSFQHSMSIT